MKKMGFFPCLAASTPMKMINWKMKSPLMTSPIVKKMTKGNKKRPRVTSPIMKRLMKAIQMRCLIIMKKRLSMLISLVLKIF
jgi:hypothetical protein